MGYRFDSDSGNIIGPDNAPLARSQYLSFLQPFNAQETVVDDRCRTMFILSGYRLNDDGGTMLSFETKKAITKLEGDIVVKFCQLGLSHQILERIRHLLLAQDPDKPLTPDVLAQIKSIADADINALSPAFRKMLEGGGGVPASAMLGEAERAYTSSVRFWDGQSSIFSQAGAAFPAAARWARVAGMNGAAFAAAAALPVVAKWTGPKKAPVYFDNSERKLGDILARELAAYLAENPVGAELLSNFKNKDGKIELPKIAILNVGKNARAFYSPAIKVIVVNQQYILDSVVQGVPEKDRKALLARLSNSKNLAEYLLANPQARSSFIAAHDVVIVHELTHAWQDRREKLLLESSRNNAPAADYLEYEHEAFLQQNRYLHRQLMTSPALGKDKSWLSNYIQLLGDFQQWRDAITQSYLRVSPEVAATIPTVESIQRERISLARRMMGEGLYQRAVQWLKIQGFERGAVELRQAGMGHDKRMEDFLHHEYPKMQFDGYKKLAELYASQDRLDRAFYARQRRQAAAKHFGDKIVRDASMQLSRSADQAVEWLAKPGRALSLDDSLCIIGTLEEYYRDQKKPPPAALQELRMPIYRQGAEKYLSMARAEEDPTRRAHELEWAEAYARAVGDQGLREQMQSIMRDKVKVP